MGNSFRGGEILQCTAQGYLRYEGVVIYSLVNETGMAYSVTVLDSELDGKWTSQFEPVRGIPVWLRRLFSNSFG